MAGEQRRQDLPADVTRLIGRRNELARIQELLAGARLVTLTGTGGAGKTRLSIAVAREAPGRARFVELETVTDGASVARTVLRALRVAEAEGDDTAAVAAHLADSHDLLVIDNCEHVLDGAAALIAAVLRDCPAVRVIATSREPLGITGEVVFPVPPLDVPPPGSPIEDLGRYAGLVLFVERAAAAQPGFAVTAENSAAVAELCRQLDGLPLAIELAAVRARALPVAELLARQAGRLDLLSSGNRAGAPRHQTLRAAMDWSFELCTPAEQQLWAGLSVFRGGFELEAVEQICGPEVDGLLEAFAGLVDKSVVSRDGATRYRQLETIRAYGHERLEASGDRERLRFRHRDAYLALAERVQAEWFGPDQVGWANRLRSERANLRTALQLCLDTGDVPIGLRMTVALSSYWMACGEQREGRQWFSRFLDASDDLPEHAPALWVAAHLAALAGDGRAALDLLGRWRDNCAADETALPHVTYVSGLARLGSDPERAATLLAEGLELERTLDDAGPHLPLAMVNLGLALCITGEPERAVAPLDEARSVCEQRDDRWVLAWALLIRGVAEWLRDDPPAATSMLREALRHKHDLGDLLGVALAFEFLAWTAEAGGDAERAARLFGASRALFEPLGSYLVAIELFLRWHEGAERRARAALGDRRYARAEETGRGLPLDEAVGYALGTGSTGPSDAQPLTRREVEVAKLLAQGLSNKEIAKQLVIAPRTADSHVEHILTKLGLRNRTQVAAWVSERRDR